MTRMWRLLRDRHPDIDPLADRLLGAGVLLTLLVPVLTAFAFGIMLLVPLLIARLPRDRQPVPPASGQESLLLITTISGPGGHEVSEKLDYINALSIATNYYYNLRVGWLRDEPADAAEAAALRERYRADLILWGAVEGDRLSLHIDTANSLHYADPKGLTISLPADQASALTSSASLLHGMHLLQAGARDSYMRSYAQPALHSLWLSREHLPFEAIELPYYLALSYGQEARTQALEVLEASFVETPEHLPTLLLLSEYQQFSGDLAGALETLDAALQIDASLPLQPRRATLLLALDRPEEAVAALEAALAAYPGDTNLRIQMAEALLRSGDLAGGDALYEQLIAEAPRNITLRLSRIDALLLRGDQQAALAGLRQVLAYALADDGLRHYEVDLRIRLAYLLLEMERDDEAQAEFAQIAILRPGQLDGPLGEGIILWREGRRSEAFSAWNRWVNASGSSDSNSLALSYALLGRDYPDAALAFATERLNMISNPYSYDEALLRQARAAAYVRLGEYQKAIDDLDQAYSLVGYAPDASYYRILGDAYWGLEQSGRALDAYLAYLQQYPNSIDQIEVQQRIAILREQLQLPAGP